jgi:ankyrin repeat protein
LKQLQCFGPLVFLASIAAAAVDPMGTPALMHATLHSTPAQMKALLERGADPNEANAAGATALMWAVHDLKKVKLLVSRGADVNAKSKEGRTPLMIAARHSESFETVRYLLERGAKANDRDVLGGTAMHAAAESGQLDVVRELVRYGAKIDEQAGPLYGVPRFGKGAGGPLPEGVGYTPLICAAELGRTGVVQYLLEKGADPNRRVITGATALALAAQEANIEIARMLLAKGAEVNAREMRQATPLIIAAAMDTTTPELIRLLIDNGADVKAQDRQGRTAYDFAAMRGNKEIMDMLKLEVQK